MSPVIELTRKDYDEIFKLSQFAFQYELSDEELQKKKAEAERHMIWGIKEEEKLAAKLHLIPLSVDVNDIKMEMGGISSVATWPEYRRQGMVKDLLFHALQVMRERKIPLSYLHPFSVPFYRKFGWEMAFANKHYEIPMKQLKQEFKGQGYVKRIERATSIMDSIYKEYVKKFNGGLIRDKKWWEQRVLKDKKAILAIAYNMEQVAEGYIIYQVKDRVLKIQEFVYTTTNIANVMLQYLSNHDSMADKVEMIVSEQDSLPLLIQEPRFNQTISPYFMARIVDVRMFLKQYFNSVQLGDYSLQFDIQDKFLPDNSGLYSLKESGGRLYFDENVSDGVIQCEIQQLASMFLGYKRPIELFELGLIRGDQKEVEKLEILIPRKKPYFLDFF